MDDKHLSSYVRFPPGAALAALALAADAMNAPASSKVHHTDRQRFAGHYRTGAKKGSTKHPQTAAKQTAKRRKKKGYK